MLALVIMLGYTVSAFDPHKYGNVVKRKNLRYSEYARITFDFTGDVDIYMYIDRILAFPSPVLVESKS